MNPVGYYAPQQPPQRDTAVPVFIAINFALGGLCALWAVLLACVLVYGIFFSGDRGQELMAGVLGSVILLAPGLVGMFVYLPAAIGMIKRKRWAYYIHLVGACYAAVSCVGLAYTIPAFIIAQRPSFRSEFFGEPADPSGFATMPPQQQAPHASNPYGQPWR